MNRLACFALLVGGCSSADPIVTVSRATVTEAGAADVAMEGSSSPATDAGVEVEAEAEAADSADAVEVEGADVIDAPLTAAEECAAHNPRLAWDGARCIDTRLTPGALVECAFGAAPDGKRRCLPVDVVMNDSVGLYADCTQPFVRVAGARSYPWGVAGEYLPPSSTIRSYVQLNEWTSSATPTFYDRLSGACAKTAARPWTHTPGGAPAIAAPVPLSVFVSSP
jgi:hypothetical protein